MNVNEDQGKRRAMWPNFWFYPMMPWVIATRLPAMFYAAWLIPPAPSMTSREPRFSAEIIPFPVRRAAIG